MTRTAALLVPLLMGIALVLQVRPAAQTHPIIEDPEANAVYAALLQNWKKRDPESTRDIRLFQETRQPISRCGEKGFVARGWEPAVENFRQANAHRWLLKTGADLGMPYAMITPPALEEILRAVVQDPAPRRGGGYEPGLRMLPVRYTALSAVGFNADRTFALVGEERHCNHLNDAGDTVLCMQGGITPWEKIGGQWVPSRNADACGWIV
jgi:hypothetical protein